MSVEIQVFRRFPAVIVDVGKGADFTVFSYPDNLPPNEQVKAADAAFTKARAYAKKYLLSAQPPIKHEIYHVKTESDFYAIIDNKP